MVTSSGVSMNDGSRSFNPSFNAVMMVFRCVDVKAFPLVMVLKSVPLNLNTS